jgi:pimeloyl-ACP methyl ester carboxylesterase
MAGLRGPVLLLHGDKDRLVSIASARVAAKANPTWRFEVAHGVGHVPQLEVPDWTAKHIRHWLGSAAATAAALTRHTHPVFAAPMTTDPRRNTE